MLFAVPAAVLAANERTEQPPRLLRVVKSTYYERDV